MKKLCAVILVVAFAFAMSSVSLAAVSPVAPTIEYPSFPADGTTVPPTTEAADPTTRPSTPVTPPTTDGDVDETTTKTPPTDKPTTTKPVASDTNPSSPDTGSVSQTLGKASAAAVAVLCLAAAGVYTSKKKVTE